MNLVSFRNLCQQTVKVDRGIFIVALFEGRRGADHERLLVPGIDFKRFFGKFPRLHEA